LAVLLNGRYAPQRIARREWLATKKKRQNEFGLIDDSQPGNVLDFGAAGDGSHGDGL
jgi:hypothetical protein